MPMEFAHLCDFLQKLEKNNHTPGVKRSASLHVATRLIHEARQTKTPEDLYSVVRLLIPKRDVERQHYNLKESALGIVLMDVLGISANSKDGQLLQNWKRTNVAAAGDFIHIAMQVIAPRHCQNTDKLSVIDINFMLDKLSQATKRNTRVEIVSELLNKASLMEIKWFMRVIFKDMKIGLGENVILDILHEDARSMMATCVDLRLVCQQLHHDASHPFRKELILGKVLKSQHSKRMNSVDAAWLAMKNSEVVAECKFDGDRMQVHRDGAKLWFWSRNGKEHPEYTVALREALYKCLLSERCVLDGELLVWDVEVGMFKARTRTLNSDAARAARKSEITNHRVCWEYGSITHLPLKRRREILNQILHPNLSPQIFCTATEDCEWTTIPASLDELKEFFWTMVEKGNEGIVVKDLHSQWVPDNRDGRWCKIKPDYVLYGSDLDLLIIGGYFGSGSRGGKIASYLLALVDDRGGSFRFTTICRCGQGLSVEEYSILESKLSPYIIKNEKGGKPPATCGYMVTNSRYECPDVWISRPEKSVVLQISSEKRICPTGTFKAGWTFRFPRIMRVRYDKCWNEALHVQEFEDIIQAAKQTGNSMLMSRNFNKLDYPLQPKRKAHTREHHVVPHLQNLDVSHIEQIDGVFEGLIFYICGNANIPGTESLQAQIKRSGGRTVPNFMHSVTHVLAREPKGLQFHVAVDNDRDIISIDWISECIDSKMLLPISPRHYLFQSRTTKEKLNMDIDAYGDPWFEDVAKDDLLQVFNNMGDKGLHVAVPLQLQQLPWKSGEDWCWNLFEGCCFYFHKPLHSKNQDSLFISMMTLRRLQVEIEMLGASVSCEVTGNITHAIIYMPSESSTVIIRRIEQSFKQSEKEILQATQVSIISHQWLEECMRKKKRLCIIPYELSKGGHLFVKKTGNMQKAPSDFNFLQRSGLEITNGDHERNGKNLVPKQLSNLCCSEVPVKDSPISTCSSKVIQGVPNHIHNSCNHVPFEFNKKENPSSSCRDRRKGRNLSSLSRDDQRKRRNPSSPSGGNKRKEENPFLLSRDDKKEQGYPFSSSRDDQRRKKLCTSQWRKSPKCRVWGETMKETRTSKTDGETMKETRIKSKMEEVKTNTNKKISLEETERDDNETSGTALTASCGLQINYAKLTQSQAVWESESLQDIAQVYLGCLCPKAPLDDILLDS